MYVLLLRCAKVMLSNKLTIPVIRCNESARYRLFFFFRRQTNQTNQNPTKAATINKNLLSPQAITYHCDADIKLG